jgi:hypothetical protein
MAADLQLGMSLVDNPVAPDSGEADDSAQEELVVMPPQLQRFGALLSTVPEGGATALYKGWFAVLSGFPVLWLFVPGYGVAYSSTRDKLLASAPNNAVVVDLCWIGGMLLSGPAALRALQRATRPNNGFLVQLGMGSAFVPRVVTEKLETSKRRLRRSMTALIALIVMFFALEFATTDGTLHVYISARHTSRSNR